MGNESSTTSELTPNVTKNLVANTHFNENEIKELHQQFMIEFPNGKFTKKDLINEYKKVYPNGNCTKYCNFVFKSIDANGSGYVDFTEYLLVLSATLKGTSEEKLMATFRLYDHDKNGKINRKEMKTLLEAICELKNAYSSKDEINRKVDKIFELFDSNNDKSISREEFIEGCRKDPKICEDLSPG